MKTIYKNCFLLLAALLFLPTALKAQDSEPMTPSEAKENGVFLNKSVTEDPNDPNKYTIHLDAFVTGEKIIESSSLPLDIVLLLDVSGSMNDGFVTESFESRRSKTYNALELIGIDGNITEDLFKLIGSLVFPIITPYYYKEGDQYYRIYVRQRAFTSIFDMRYVMYYEASDGVHELGNQSSTNLFEFFLGSIYTGVLYVKQQTTTKKINAMKTAATAFVNSIAADAEKTGVEHRVSIVKFAGKVGNTSGSTQIVSNLTNDYSSVITSLNNLSANGATSADYGMDLVKTELTDNARNDSFQAVVILTDGQPNHSNGFDDKVADDAIKKSKELKDKGVHVYTIYVGATDDIEEPRNPASVDNNSRVTQVMWNYMNAVSSNYPKATSYLGSQLGDRASKGEYYHMVSSADELTNIFTEIGADIISGGAYYILDEETEIRDIVSQSFMLPIGAKASDIHLTISKLKTVIKDTDGNVTGYEFEDPSPAPEGVYAEVPDETEKKRDVRVKGFDFASHFVGEIKQPDETYLLNPDACRLNIDFVIVIDPDAPGGADVPTNEITSGIYIDGEPIATFNVPSVKIPNVVVIKKGMHKGESAIFTIQRVKSYRMDESGNIVNPKFTDIKLVATCTEEGKDAVAVMKLQIPGRYRVIEDTWSWAYDLSKVESDYGDLDDVDKSNDEWLQKGFWSEDMDVPVLGYKAHRPVDEKDFGTKVNLSERWIERNVNDFTQNKTSLYVGTEFIFVNEEKANTPAHAEGQVNNEFYVRPMKN